MKLLTTLLLCLAIAAPTFAQIGPEVTAWKVNVTGATGYANIPSNVQQVQYSATQVYVSATCIPGYSIGPWAGNPNTPRNQNFVFKIARQPQPNTGTLTANGLGHIGVWTNGVSIFNAKDAFSYNNQGKWNQDAYVFEGASFDDCLGHPAPNGEYHHHINPACLYTTADTLNHSPIIGYAFDGFPVYGASGYADTLGGGGIRRMRTSYRLRNITSRTTLPDGTVLPANQYGPAFSGRYTLGAYVEDYEFVAGHGDLDKHNGRFCITPEYPNGTYAYFVTVNSALRPQYPYAIGPFYYGRVQAGNTGPQGGHVVISEPVTTYNPATATAPLASSSLQFKLWPNPATDAAFLHLDAIAANNFTLKLIDAQGKIAYTQINIQPTITYTIPMQALRPGLYQLQLANVTQTTYTRLVKI